MKKNIYLSAVLFALACLCAPGVTAQETTAAKKGDDSSRQVEQREDSYRRQMELEDARNRERTYVDNTYTQAAELEKIDKLPEESRDNIRDQLVDVIMENGEWEPSDALAEYPYQPTEAAEADPELMEQEQAAWDEQIEKYHEREAAAFGSYRGPVPGPGNPDGQEGTEQGQGTAGKQAAGQDGGAEKSGSVDAGAYQSYLSNASDSEDAVSTEGVSESALDFLRSAQMTAAAPSAPAQAQAQAQARAQAQAQAQAQSQENTDQADEESPTQVAEQSAGQDSEQTREEQQQSSTDIQLDLRGIIAIKDLDKLEGAESPPEPEEPDQ